MKHQLITTAGRTVDTHKWDTVSAIHISELNDAIRLAKTSPSGFSHGAGKGVQVDAEFGDWNILPDSDGPILSMELPLAAIKIEDCDGTRNFASGSAMVDVHLELLPHGPNSDNNTVLHLLVVKITSQKRGRSAANVTKVTIDQSHSMADTVYVTMALENWLDANLHNFTQVFATVNIHKVVEQNEAFAWLKPTHVAYAFGYNSTDPSKSVLGVLCQTGGRSAKGLIYQIEANVIPTGSTVVYVISKARFLRDMLTTALPKAFDGLMAKNLKVAPDNSGVKMINPTQLKNIEHEGKTYDLELTELDVKLFDTEINVDSITKTPVFPGIFSVCTAIGYYSFGLLTKKDGSKTLGFDESRPFQSINTTEKTTGAIITEIILGIIAAVAGLVLFFVTFGSGSLIAAALYVALVGSMGTLTIMQIAELVGEGDGPPIDLLIANATNAVTWASGSRFDPNTAGLNGALQIGGTFVDDPALEGAGRNATTPQEAFQSKYEIRMQERVQ